MSRDDEYSANAVWWSGYVIIFEIVISTILITTIEIAGYYLEISGSDSTKRWIRRLKTGGKILFLVWIFWLAWRLDIFG